MVGTQSIGDGPRCVGPYVIERLLGRGGYGAVHVARHESSGVLVALKTVTSLSESRLAGLRREIACLAAIGARGFPGLARIVDSGLEGGLPWVAMELVTGRTLRQLIMQGQGLVTGYEPTINLTGPALAMATAVAASSGRDTGEAGTSSLRELLGVVERVCHPLALLHGEGIVHGDIKPENIIVRASGEAVIVDFGLTSRFSGEVSRESLEIAGEIEGTLAYMSPERLRGEHVDARADLYALGCLLYELIAGRPPFQGWGQMEIIRQHLEVAPPPLAGVARISAEIEAVISQLLAKDVRERIGYAQDVARALARERNEVPRPFQPRPRPYLFRTEFVGREATLGELRGRLAGLPDGKGGVVFIGAESGAGKTRLLKEVGGRARAMGLTVLVGESLGDGLDAPLATLRAALQEIGDRCRAEGAATTARILGSRAGRLAVYEPSLADLPGIIDDVEAAVLPPRAARQRLFADIVDTLRAVAEPEGLLLALDDVQRADELTLDLLSFLGPALAPPCPVLVLAAYRPEERSDALRRATETPGATSITLDRMDEPAVASLTADALAVHPAPAELVAFLAQASEGNPFFVAEYLRSAVDERLLVREELGAWRLSAKVEALPLPRSLRDLVSRRIERMEPIPLRIAEVAAILGRDIDEGVLRDALSSFRVGSSLVDGGIAELIVRQVLLDAGPGKLRFTHDKLREMAYQRLSPADRANGHGACARAIEARGAPRTLEWLSELARQWDEAGQPLRAAELCREAAPLAVAAGAFEAAERLYRSYLAIAPAPTAQSARARNALSWDVLRPTGRYADALVEHRRALDEARGLGSTAEIALSLRGTATALRLLGHIDQCIADAQEALALARELGDGELTGLLTTDIGIVTLERGDIHGALAIHKEALERAHQRGDRGAEATSLSNIAVALGALGDVAGAMAAQEEAVALLRERGERFNLGIALGNLAAFCMDAGQEMRAAAILEEGIALNRRIGNRHSEAILLGNLALSMQGRGERAQARILIDRSLALHTVVGDRRSRAITTGHLAGFLLDDGDVVGALKAYEESMEGLVAVGDLRYVSQARIELARCKRIGTGEPTDGREIDEAIAVLQGMGDPVSAATGRVEQVHQALARGESAERELAILRQAAVSLGKRGSVALRSAMEAAERAGAGRRAGAALRYGEAPEDLPPALRGGLPGPAP